MSAAKLGIIGVPDAVKILDSPVVCMPNCFAMFRSIDVLVAPVSSNAITVIEGNNEVGTASSRNALALEISTGKVNPDLNNGNGEKLIVTRTPLGNGVSVTMPDCWWNTIITPMLVREN
jgi:hypothetical protein